MSEKIAPAMFLGDVFIEFGEQNMMGVAAGLSTTGFLPYASTHAAFFSRRACDQLMVSIVVTMLFNDPGKLQSK